MNKNIRTFLPLILLFVVLFIYLLFGLINSLINNDDDSSSTEVTDLTSGEIDRMVYETYVVKEGDTLSSIATEYGLSESTIIDNNLLSSNELYEGQNLIILPQDCVLAIVEQGDTIESISEKYGSSIDIIADFNLLDYPYSLTVGQKLFIPYSTL